MKAMKDCEWKVTIYQVGGEHWWDARPDDPEGCSLEMEGYLPTDRKAKNNWKKFAKLNGITKYIFT